MTISAAHMARGDNSPTNPLVPKVTYLCGPRGPEYRRAGVGQTTQVWWYCGARPEERRDGLGSVLAEVSPTGTITGARQADVYGAPRATQGTPTSKHAYVGALGHPTEDDSGLIYMRARWMDPVTGTFVSEDPGKAGDQLVRVLRWQPGQRRGPDRAHRRGASGVLGGVRRAAREGWVGRVRRHRCRVPSDLRREGGTAGCGVRGAWRSFGCRLGADCCCSGSGWPATAAGWRGHGDRAGCHRFLRPGVHPSDG